MKILITGAAGNIGSSLAERLVSLPDCEVVAFDNLLTGDAAKLPAGKKNFSFVQGDVNRIEELEPVMSRQRFDHVFHYAAVVGVQRTLENPVLVLEDIKGIRNVLDLARQTGVKRVFYSSSSEVYGEPVEFPQHEHTTPLNSRLPYAVVKNVGEAFLRSYNKEYGLPFTIFRFFNTYGPRQSEDFVVTRFLKQALAGDPITVYGTGLQTRTFCYIDDNVDTTVKCLNDNQCINDVMNVGNDEEITVKDLAYKVISLTGSKSEVRFLPALKEGDMSRRRPDNKKMRQVLGRPLTSLDEGLRKTLEKKMF